MADFLFVYAYSFYRGIEICIKIDYMRKQFTVFAIVLCFIACNNSTSTQEGTVDSVVAVSADTIKEIEIIKTPADPTALTETEIKDDSVFSDGSIPASWANAGFTDAVAVKKFLKKIQYWVAKGEKDSVAATVAYPLRKPAVKNRESFLKNYDSLLNDKVKKALREQNLSQLFRNAQGVMVGSGEIWINETSKGLKIIAINN